MRFHGISFEYIFWHNVISRDKPTVEPQWYSFLNMNMKMEYGCRSHIIRMAKSCSHFIWNKNIILSRVS